MVAQKYRWDFIGLSTDTKPTAETSEKVVNGSTYYCSDTSKLYVYCNGTWYERKPLGGGGGGGTSNFNDLSNRPKYNGSEMTGSTDIPEVKSYTAGTNVSISDQNVISATDTTYTAGTNVSISDQNVISATDTTYSAFTGTDGTTAGAAGLVPAPTTTDAGKFLKADGTWDTAGGGSTYTAGDGIDITNDVISATNTGKAKVLTSADYNYHSSGDTDDGVALWLLSPGLYTWTPGTGVYSVKNNFYVNEYGAALIRPESGGIVPLYFCRNYSDTYFERVFKNSGARSGNLETILTDVFVINNLSSTTTNLPLSANQGKILKDLVDSIAIRGAGAPATTTAGQVGTLYEDTTNGDLYICTDATNPYVWEEVGAGGGSGPTVVQTTGTSQTDVMSQNAVTSMVYANESTAQVRIGNNGSIDNYSVSIGQNGSVNSRHSIGIKGTASATQSVAIGNKSSASALNSVALGTFAAASVQGQMDISTSEAPSGSYVGYNNSNYRLLTGLYDGQSDHDAATVGQIKMGVLSATPTGTTAGFPGRLYTYDSGGGTYEVYLCVHDNGDNTYVWKQVSLI